MKIKYELCKTMVETRDGKDALGKYVNQIDQNYTSVAAFDDFEEAKKAYEEEKTNVNYCGYVHGVPLFEHHCKFLLKNEYDEAGEWVDGGDWCLSEFPNYKEEV